MQKKSLSLAKLWSLLRDQERQLGLDKLSLTERDIFLCILFEGSITVPPLSKISYFLSFVFIKRLSDYFHSNNIISFCILNEIYGNLCVGI